MDLSQETNKKVLFLFVDGLGIGPADPSINPLLAARLPHLESLVGSIDMGRWREGVHTGRASLVPLDATLGVAGLPQSATGQTALFTGVNAAKLVGRHKEGRPNRLLKSVLYKHGLIPVLRRAGLRATFANAYTTASIPRYVAGEAPMSCTSAMTYYGEGGFRSSEMFNRGEAVYFDLTGRYARRRGDDVMLMTPARAGEALARIALAHDFTLYEYFLTDFAGHRQNTRRAVRYLEDVDAALGAVLNYYDLERYLLMLTSDHGNVEDLSTRSHTKNPVPLLAAGAGHDEFASSCDDLMDVAPATFKYFGVDPVKHSGQPIRVELIKLPE
jgi:2,3-bisphosphoglycerate-independent phosphoglycerate mutase